MSRRPRFGVVAFCVLVTLPFTEVASECTKYSLIQNAGFTGGPLYLRWPCAASIALGCVNCPGDAWNAGVERAKNSWAGQNSSYSFTSGSNVVWVTANWPANLVDLHTTGAAMEYTQDVNGYINVGSIWINNADNWFEVGYDTPSAGYVDFESVMIHEIGHVLGLADADCFSVMSALSTQEYDRYPHSLDGEAIDLLYCCGAQNRVLASGEVVQLPTSCGDINPAAEISGLRVSSGGVAWTVWHEQETSEYLVEGLPVLEGPGVTLAREGAGIGPHSVQLGPHSFPYLRLVEVENGGARTVLDVIGAQAAPTVDATETRAGTAEQAAIVAPPHAALPTGERVIMVL